MVLFTISIAKELRRDLKELAAKKETTMREIVTELISGYIRKEKGE